MEQIKRYILNYKDIFFFTLIILLEIIILYILCINKNEPITYQNIENDKKTEEKEEEKNENKIKIEIKGAVNSPGVYELDSNSRVIDAINISGGLLENASTNIINLSKILEDQMVIIIYTNEEINNYLNTQNKEIIKTKIEYVYLEKECICPDKINEACIKDEVYASVDTLKKEDTIEDVKENEVKQENNSNNYININTSSLEELKNIDGIGEAKAKSIIEYRNIKKFEKIEDIKNVTGIGESIFEKIKDKITV